MSERNTTQLMSAAVLGGLLGAGLAMFLSPRSGSENRQQLQENVDKLKSEAGIKYGQARQNIRRSVAEVRDLKDRLRQAARQPQSNALPEDQDYEESNINSHRPSPVLSAWEEEV